MKTTRRTVHASRDEVWDVLCDGWLYPLWVVGAVRARDLDASWPSPGSRLHHSVGLWPALLDDHTEVIDVDPGNALVLRARAWPTGEATVRLVLSGPAEGPTEVVMDEDVSSGPMRVVPSPLRAPLIRWRNTEALRRFARLAEGRARTGRSG